MLQFNLLTLIFPLEVENITKGSISADSIQTWGNSARISKAYQEINYKCDIFCHVQNETLLYIRCFKVIPFFFFTSTLSKQLAWRPAFARYSRNTVCIHKLKHLSLIYVLSRLMRSTNLPGGEARRAEEVSARLYPDVLHILSAYLAHLKRIKCVRPSDSNFI